MLSMQTWLHSKVYCRKTCTLVHAAHPGLCPDLYTKGKIHCCYTPDVKLGQSKHQTYVYYISYTYLVKCMQPRQTEGHLFHILVYLEDNLPSTIIHIQNIHYCTACTSIPITLFVSYKYYRYMKLKRQKICQKIFYVTFIN